MAEDVLVVEDAETGSPTARRTFDGHEVECLAAGADTPARAFCGTFESGLHRTDDAGETWERVGAEALPESVTSVAVSPHDPGVVYAGTEPSAVFESVDAGETWTELDGLTDLPSASEWSFPPRPDTHHARWVEPDPNDPDHLYVGVEAGALVQTRDGGETWEDRVPSARRDTHSMTTHADEPGRAWVAAGDGYAETRDGGETWTHPQEGLDHRYCWSVVVDRADPSRVLLSSASGPRSAHRAGSAESYLYRRESGAGGDDGGAWERLDDVGIPTGSGVVRAVLARGDDGGEFYAVTNRGLYRTADGGDSFDRLDVPWPDAYEGQTPSGLVAVGETER
ncbi:WD40/YVTN/BNR-like repeat-containing protein [Halogeometricum luteum]|uniref:BNR/Asp-box repeat-containing protein n=1 Tax=Halogeometricum luteum TaxID=2950537 RepID=A0ABU2G6I7_9EURY|nr:hypothetical protein [Halogeometricum sp. S3BR5-2]MDS0296403.1 hypothetical protein [Halogeometricum sp. S3BR5-2]